MILNVLDEREEYAKILDIRRRLLTNSITYDKAKEEATPIIEIMNIKARAIAKKHGKRFYGFTFSSLMR